MQHEVQGLTKSDGAVVARELRVSTVNVHLLPTLAVPFAGCRGQHEYRAAEFGRRLRGSDIIGFCEAFHAKHSSDLLNALEAAGEQKFHVVRGPGRSGRHLTNSGLMLVSRFPFVVTNLYKFESSTRLLQHGVKNDGLAAKGVLHARIQLEAGSQLDCFLTHMESQNVTVRSAQVSELCEFVRLHRSPRLPAVLLGDFNIVGPKAEVLPGSGNEEFNEYADLITKLNRENPKFQDIGLFLGGAVGTGDAVSEDGGSRIDYIFCFKRDRCRASTSGLSCLERSTSR